MDDLKKILENQIMPMDECDTLLQIANMDFNKRQRIERGGLLSTLTDCFNYGVMVGKRQERARHKKYISE